MAYSIKLKATTEKQEKSVESDVLGAQVITNADGDHFVFLSNEAGCLRVGIPMKGNADSSGKPKRCSGEREQPTERSDADKLSVCRKVFSFVNHHP
jgi:hypothetical protein